MLHQKYTLFCMKEIKTQGSPGGIRNIEIFEIFLLQADLFENRFLKC